MAGKPLALYLKDIQVHVTTVNKILSDFTAMEDLLQQIVKESSGSSSSASKYVELRTVCKEVHDFLEAQQGSLRAPPHELRERCLAALKLSLESKSSKLVSLAVVGFQKFLRDDRFHSRLECESASEWLPSQLLSAVSSLGSQPDDVQLDLLKVLLNMAAACTTISTASAESTPWSLSEPVTVLNVLDVCRCAHARSSSSPAVKTAARATAGQTLRAFCDHVAGEESAIRANPFCCNLCPDGDEESGVSESAFDKVVVLLNHFCEKLQQRQSTSGKNNNSKENNVQFNLECVLALVSSLSTDASGSTTLRNHLWQELCPTLLSLLGTPTTEITIGVVADGHLASVKQSIKCPSVLTAAEIKTVYGICVELVRLVGLVGGLRPMLESMFHRILLSTSAVQRFEALRATKEIMRKGELLLSFAGPPMVVDKNGSCSTDLGLLKLAMDAFVECSGCMDRRVSHASVECVVALLSSLERICEGHGIGAVLVTRINKLYDGLESADYKGPMTYQTWEKLHKLTPPKKKRTDTEFNGLDEDKASVEVDNHLDVKDRDTGDDESDPAEAVAAVGTAARVEVDFPSGYETDSSGSTEGPEEGYEDDNEGDDEQEYVVADGKGDGNSDDDIVSDRRWKVPRTLIGEENVRAEHERMAQLYETRDMYSKLERRNARHFVHTFRDVLPAWLRIKSSIEADEHMQEFASNYCRDVVSGQQSLDECQGSVHRMIINADGVYLAMYASLLLNFKLILSGYYKETGREPPQTEDEFVDDVHRSGVLVYLSADWLAELYQHVLSDNFLGSAGYDRSSSDNSALVNLLTDLEGTNGTHLLSDYYRLEKTVINDDDELDVNAGRKFARRVLTGCWDDILEVLRAQLRDKHGGVGLLSSNIGFIFGGGGGTADGTSKCERNRGSGDAVAASLEGLQKAARLSSILDLHSRCESVFSMLSATSCPPATATVQNTPTRRRRLKASVLALGKRRPIRLHVSHVLSMDVILYRGLELGSHCPHCWKHVFRCCFYLAELEHSFFSRGISGAATAAVAAPTPPSVLASRRNATGVGLMHPCKPDDFDFQENEISVSSIPLPGSASPLSVNDLVKQSTSSLSLSGVLTEVQSARILCSLSQQVDRLFDDAAYKLNLKSLLSFLTELSSESQTALFSKVGSVNTTASGSSLTSKNELGLESNNSTSLHQTHHDYHGNTLLLHRLGDVMLKCVRSGRPLVHVMQAWSIVGLHLMEAACHGDQDVAKRAVTCIHDVVSSLLGVQTELPYFHFNEALFKPFESLLCLELCDIDIQDQIISSICEFVEGSKTEIRSGWRPLFGALRAVRPHRAILIPPCSPSLNPATPNAVVCDPFVVQADSGHAINRHIVLDVFDAFLNAESNALVFANAAVDCILCLLKHIQGPSADEESPVEENGDGGTCIKDGFRHKSSTCRSDLCLPSLKYIHTCCQTLASMHLMHNCPIFHASNRIQLGSETQFVDPIIPGLNLVVYGKDNDCGDGDSNSSTSTSPKESSVVEALHGFTPGFGAATLDELERPSGILHVWCLILEGLVGATANCPRRYQPDAVHALFSILKKIYELPGVEFGLYVVNHILLPMMQSWLRRSSKLQPRAISGFATNFKQCCGQTTDLVVDYLTKLADSGQLSSASGGSFLLYQTFLLMTECVAQPNESISRLGCSCIRHVIVTSGPLLTFELWDVTVTALRRISDVSLFHVKQLMAAFKRDSDNFYGDLCQVKVAAKSDCSSHENERLKQLAQQVFLLDNQRVISNGALLDDPIDDDKSYMFLLYSTDSSKRGNIDQSQIVKVSFRSMVVGLVSHQLLLQTIGLLLSSASHVVPSLANILLQSPAQTSTFCEKQGVNVGSSGGVQQLPGMMRYLSGEQVSSLMECLKDSYDVSCQFDARPGLKFLVQKVARARAAANLYKQSGASWTLRAVTLLELCLYRIQKTKNVAFDAAEPYPPPKFLNFCFDELRATFDEACAAYVEHFTVAKKGGEDRFVRLQDQPIFFLVAHDVEDYMESRQRGEESKSVEQQQTLESSSTERPSPREEHGSELQLHQDDHCPKKCVESPPETGRDALDEFEGSDVDDDDDDDDGDKSEFEENVNEENEGKTRVYEVATQKDIDSMVNEYKKRKRQCSMPPPLDDKKRSKDCGVKRRPEREKTKLASVLKDHQACIKVRTEMLLSMFDFFCQIDDVQFEALLSEVTFPFVRTLIAHGNDPTLRQTLAEFMDRIARIYGFANTGILSS